MTKTFIEKELMKRHSNTLEAHEAIQSSLKELKKKGFFVEVYDGDEGKTKVVEWSDIEKVFGRIEE